MKLKYRLFFNLFVIIGLIITLFGGKAHTVSAATCTWLGVNNTWGNISNWSCGHVPTSIDDVVIANQTNDPIITNTPTTISVNSLTINSGASLIDDSATLYIYANSMVNNGTLKTQGMDSALILVFSPINNSSQIYANAGMINLEYGGTHSGSFIGVGEIIITGTAHTFLSSTTISVKKISFIFTDELNLPGQFNQHLEDSRVNIDNANVTITNTINLKIGAVTILSGSLTIAQFGTTTGSVRVPLNSTLVGTGTVSGDLDNAGTVSPGTSPGTITIDGNYTQESTGVLAMEIGGTTPDIQYDQFLVSGTAALDGTLEVSLIESFTPAQGDNFILMTYASHTGTFATANLPELGPGLVWEIDYGNTALSLTVVVPSGGTIEGTVTYTGVEVGEEITIGLFTNPDGPPVDLIDVPSNDGTYTFSGLADGTYAICALMDLIDNDQPDPGEPFNCYDDDSDGDPDLIVISDSSSHTNIDFELIDPSLIQGTVTYTGSLGVMGPISVSVHPAVGAEPSASAEGIQSGETYSIFDLEPGSYYISAYLDIDSSGGPPDPNEPLAWYDENGDGTPDPVEISTAGEVVTGKDILLEDSLYLYLPLIVR